MSRLLKFIVFATSLVTVHSLESFSFEYKVKEEITTPNDWFNVSQPLVEHKIHLRIGLPLLSFSELEKQLYEVSDPDHHRYGQHLSKAEVEALIRPSRDSVDAVNAWLSSFGLTGRDITRSPASDWVTIKVPIGIAEKMLDTVSFSCPYRPFNRRMC
jgi:tripeptidyl-peptidase-1